MAFTPPRKGQELVPVVRAYFGSNLKTDLTTAPYTDISAYVRRAISFQYGRSDNAGTADPANTGLTLANSDGQFTAQNPFSTHWPNVRRNVPLWVGVTWDGAEDVYELLTTFVNGWPLMPTNGIFDVETPITATGRLRQMRRSQKTAVSAQTRTIPRSNPIAWWPLEDGTESTQAASGLPGGRPMQVKGVVSFASGDGTPGSGPLADLSTGGQLIATLPVITSTSYRIEFAMRCPTVSDFLAIMDWYTPGGGIDFWEINVTDLIDGGLYVQWASGASFGGPFVSNVAVDDDQWHHVRIDMSNSGGNHKIVVTLDGSAVITQTTSQAWSVASTLYVNPTGDIDEEIPRFGQLAVWGPFSGSVDTLAAFRGFAGELATDRVTRLCAEAGIPVNVTVGDAPAQPMGAQGIDTLSNLLDACAALDNGLLHDGGPLGSLVYASGTARYNADIAFTISNGQLGNAFSGVYDDQSLVNRQQVSRVNGSSAIYEDTDSEAVDDDYNAQATLNAATDAQLSDIASFRTHLGTFDGYRYAAIPLDARHLPELVEALLNLTLPARISPDDLPLPFPPGSLDQFVEGFRATLDTDNWTYTLNCTPFEPWRMGVYDESKADSGSSTLGTAVAAGSAGDTITLSVATSLAGDLWTTDSAQWTAGASGPLYAYLDGEIGQVTNITGTTSPQSITIIRGINGVAIKHPVGVEVHVWQAAVAAL